MDDPIWRKFHFMMGLNNDIAKTIFTNNHESLEEFYSGAFKLKAKVTQPRAHFATSKLQGYEHEDGTTKMTKLDGLQDNAPKFDFADIHLCGIDNAESSMTLFEDGVAMTTTTEQMKEHALDASNKVESKDDASIFGGESEVIEHRIFPSIMEVSDDVPSLAFIHSDGDEMVEHGIFPSTTVVFGDELSDLCHHIESESPFTTSPIHDELPQFPCEESHKPHHLSEMSDSTICEFESTYLEGVCEPPHR
ncbi:gag-pol polyprotein [Hordeum vulgare]|nr:gag-pol polyprotein [Hordeum vulgare]